VGPEDWEPAVASTDGPQIVVGGPGTGKTEFLVRRAAHLVGAGVPADSILVVAFGRRGVADLERRIAAATPPDSPPITVTTFHALAAGLVEVHFRDRGWRRPPQILTGPEQAALVRRLLAEEDPAAWSVAMRPLLSTRTFADEVTDFLLRSGEQLQDADDVAAMDRDEWRGLPAFMGRYRRRLIADGRIDYGMILAEAVAVLADHPLNPGYVLVDEYQDTTAAQVGLLRVLAANGNITAAADPYQSIYSFRGAAVENVARFGETFAGVGPPARRVALTTSFRTPQAILRAAERVAGGDIPGAAGPVVPAPGDGRVDLHRFHQQTAEAEWIAAEILRLNLRDRLRFGSMAVFVRSKRRFVAELSRALSRRGIPHEPPSSRTAEQPEVRFLLDLVAAATTPESPGLDRHVRHLLLGPWFGLSLGQVRDVEREQAATGHWVATLRPSFPELAALLADDSWATTAAAAEGAWAVWESLPQLTAITTGDEHRRSRRAWASLLQVLTRWNERNPAGTLVEYAALLDEESFEARPLVSYRAPDDDQVTVTTLHQAKGLEFEVVFIADAVEGVFPDLRTQDSLLGVRHLLADVPHDTPGYRRFRLQEERRLAYTAMTRASRRVVWTATSTGSDMGQGLPSRFFALAAGVETVEKAVQEPPGHAPVTVAEAEGLLRRLAGDPEASIELSGGGGPPVVHAGRPLREAAIAVLADGTRWGMRPVTSFAGFRRRGPDTGLVELPLRLSPSQGESYEQCPRRHALTRRLAIGEAGSYHAELGSLVHTVMENVERAVIETPGAPPSTLADATAELDRLFDGFVFGGEPHATAWRRRAGIVIEQLYQKRPAGGRPVMVERRLEMDHAGTRWVGRVDLIEGRPAGLAIVDYKTGSTTPTRAEAAESLQLGFYVLAGREDPQIADRGEVAGAEMWFPWASRDQKNLKRLELDMANLPAVAERMAAVAGGITAEDWTPVPGEHCDRCPVRTVCPAWPEGAEGFVA
jgi:superfamily I DNA/RNA helicase/RecB family exonuclease